ncbi:MAG: GGDEF domain-containing phosphodiesterase [Bacteroidales bacterium]|nr:GGDEF domain-containing phosphodiesterase [Bacteroidales bacterium]MCM1415070.1 GGDEF domain-containing phosphodiesterase [bacterium]MCM1424265.1 GGDEF domain-containing phosphodiesterase [bacterium]
MKDVLTGLDSYEIFLDKLQKEIDAIGDDKIAIIYSDIKHFKYINDTYGYKVGDSLLKEFVEDFMASSEYILCASRVYSDNFVVANRLTADLFSSNEEFRQMIYQMNLDREAKFREKYLNSRLQFCTGISIMDKNSRNLEAETAVSNANLARKVAKEMESECCVLFDQSMMEGIKREVEITSGIPRALEQKEFQVYFQPKMDTDTLDLIGAEALVRWKKPDGRFIYPDEFIPLIERSGQIVDVDFYVYREVFRFLSERIKEGKKVVPISLNVSRMHLNRTDFLDYVESLLDEFQVPCSLIEFELTESIYLENTERALELIKGLHNLGIKVSMDDFGSGYSSLNLLSKLPIDIIKLDKVFLKEGEMQESDRIIISCVVEMAKKLHITSLCEGVETQEQSDYLKEVGCQMQQGFYFSRPIPKEVFESYMEESV